MNPIPAAFLTATITTLSRWSRGKGLTVNTVVGLVGIAVGLALLDQFNESFAKAMGALIVIGTLVAQGPTLWNAVAKATK
jgi:hypothetical protein